MSKTIGHFEMHGSFTTFPLGAAAILDQDLIIADPSVRPAITSAVFELTYPSALAAARPVELEYHYC
jgi:hypothetical protein